MTAVSVSNVSARARIEQAFTRFKQSVTRDDAISFQSTELRDVRQAAIDIQEWQRRRNSFHNLRRIDPLLRGIEKYSKALDVLCNGTPFLPWVWAPIKLMLQLAREHTSGLEILLDAYAKIGECLPRCDRYETALPDPQMQDVLALLYEDIIEFHRRAYKYFRRKAWKVLLDSTWISFEHRFKTILDRLRHHQDMIDKEAVSFDIVEAKLTRDKIDAELEKSERERASLHLHDVMEWLGVNDREQEDDLWRLQSRRFPDTGEWLFENNVFVSWDKSPEKNPVLWLWGKPGSGKSVACASIIQKLKQIPDVPVLYYFCRYQQTHESSHCSHLLRTLTTQLIRYDIELSSFVWEEHFKKGHTASIEHLRDLLPKLMAASEKIRILIDGLDEALLAEHKLILETLLYIQTSTKHQSSLLISSRNIPSIEKKMRGQPKIAFKDEEKALCRDIALFVKGRLDQIVEDCTLEFSDATIKQITEELITRSNGMFLWVELVIGSLEYSLNDEDVLNAVKRLPKTLHEAYDRILLTMQTNLEAPIHDKVLRILQWITYSVRPVKVPEVLNAVGFINVPIGDHEPRTTPPRILEFCKPLIEVSNTGILEFVHFTAQEYFLEKTSKHHLPNKIAQFNITANCLDYIATTPLFASTDRLDERVRQILIGQRAMHRYATIYWMSHLMSFCKADWQDEASLNLVNKLHRIDWLAKSQHSNSDSSTTGFSERFRDVSTWNVDAQVMRMLQDMDQFQGSLKLPDKDSVSSEITVEQMLQNDPTFLTAINAQYEADIVYLMTEIRAEDLPQGLDAETLIKFRQDNALESCHCRHLNCPKSINGFRTREERDIHEASHVRKLQCEVQNCPFNGRGFKKWRDLQVHKKRYHAQLVDDPIPDVISAPMKINNLSSVNDGFPSDNAPDSTFNLDFSTLQHTDLLENFDFDSFLNTSADDTKFAFDATGIEYLGMGNNE